MYPVETQNQNCPIPKACTIRPTSTMLAASALSSISKASLARYRAERTANSGKSGASRRLRLRCGNGRRRRRSDSNSARFFAKETRRFGFALPDPGEYGVAMCFLPVERQQRLVCEGLVEKISAKKASRCWDGATLRWKAMLSAGWRGPPSPTSSNYLLAARLNMEADEFERKLYVVRKR